MKKKSNTQSLGDAIAEFLEQYKHSNKIQEAEIVASWSRVMGSNIAKYTLETYYKNNTLFVKLKSAPLREELSMQRSRIKDALNEHLGMDCIKKVVFT